jgi:hypothetical protein
MNNKQQEVKFSENEINHLIGELLPKVASRDDNYIWSILHRLTEIIVKQQQEIEKLKK